MYIYVCFISYIHVYVKEIYLIYTVYIYVNKSQYTYMYVIHVHQDIIYTIVQLNIENNEQKHQQQYQFIKVSIAFGKAIIIAKILRNIYIYIYSYNYVDHTNFM